GGTSAAWAETAPPPSMAQPFAITSPTFSAANEATIKGTMTAGSTVTVTVGSAECVALPADPTDVDWNCTLSLPNGPGQLLTAKETLEDATAGAQATQTLAVLGPPTVNSTPTQESPGVARGTGYPGSTITLLVNGTAQACNAPVAGTREWLCTIAGGPGTYQVQPTQAVAAMGTSNPGNQQTIVVNPKPPVETPDPVIPPPAPEPAPVLPPPAPSPTDEPEPVPAPTPSERAD